MYQIIGIQRNKQQRLLATPETAKEARSAHAASAKEYGSMIIVDPAGERIDFEELNRRANQEA